MKKDHYENSIWQWKIIEYLAYAAVSIIPLYIGMNHWFPYNAPKAILMTFFAWIMLVFYGWGLLSRKKEEFLLGITPVHLVLFIFLLVLTISSFVGIDPHNSFFGIWSNSISLVLLYSLSIFACLIGFLIKRDGNILIKLITVSFVVSTGSALLSYWGKNLFRLSGNGSTLGNSSFAGAYLLFIVCFGIGLFFYFEKKWQKLLAAIGTVIIVFCPLFFNQEILKGTTSFSQILENPLVLLGEANGAAIGVVVAVIIMISLFLIQNNKKSIQVIGSILFVTMISGMFVTGFLLVNPVTNLHQRFIEEKTGNRFLFWDIAGSGLMEKPLLGNGFNNYIYTYKKYYVTDFYKPRYQVEEWTNQPHNIVWEYLSTTGILGIISFFTLLGVVFLVFFLQSNKGDKYRIIKVVLAGSLVGYFIQNLFVFDVAITYFLLFLVIGIAMGLSQKQKIFRVTKKWNLDKMIIYTGILLSFFAIIFFAFLPWKESKKWQKATRKDITQIGFDDLALIQETSLLGGVADSAFFVDSFFSKHQNEIIKNITKTNSFEVLISAEDFLEDEIKKQPFNFRVRMAIANIMIMHMYLDPATKDILWDRALDHIQQAHTLSVQNPDTYFTIANLYIIKKDYSQARVYTRAGVALVPEYGQGYVIADVLLRVAPNKEFEQYINKMKKINNRIPTIDIQ